MKHKSETFEWFKEFQSEVENHRKKKIKFLRSDHGGAKMIISGKLNDWHGMDVKVEPLKF